MPDRNIGITFDKSKPLHRALLELDLDNRAERFVVMNRNTLGVLIHLFPPSDGTFKMYFRTRFGSTFDLSIILFDDNLEFGAEIVDGVKLAIVDVHKVNNG